MITKYKSDVCIVGLGPAGIGTALTLANSNLEYHVICLDSGASVTDRTCSILQNDNCNKEKPCQMISGFGGCSLLSAGKISVFPAGSKLVTLLGSKDLAERKISEAFRLFNYYLHLHQPNITTTDIKKAKELFEKLGFGYKYYDSYLFNKEEIQKAYQKISLQLTSAGMELLMNTKLIRVDYEKNEFRLTIRKDNQNVIIFTKYLILGVGRLGQNFLKSLNRKLNLGGRNNHLEIGVRLEFPTEIYPDIDKYHKDLKLFYNNIRTYCICKEGKLAPYYLNDMFILDGYSNPANKTNFTNLGIMLRLDHYDQNNQTINEIKKRILKISNGKPVRQMLIDYLNLKIKNKTPSTLSGNSISFWVDGDVSKCFPEPFSTRIMEGVHKFISTTLSDVSWEKVSVFAPAIEYSWLKFPIKSDFSILPKMYLVGDCAGQFRGILQSFCSGIICAESIIGKVYEKKL